MSRGIDAASQKLPMNIPHAMTYDEYMQQYKRNTPIFYPRYYLKIFIFFRKYETIFFL